MSGLTFKYLVEPVSSWFNLYLHGLPFNCLV